VSDCLAANRTLASMPGFLPICASPDTPQAMHGWRRWVGMGIAIGIICSLIPVLFGRRAAHVDSTAALGRLSPRKAVEVASPDLDGLDLLRLTLHQDRVTSPLPNGLTAELTLEPDLQRSASSVMKRYAIPEAGVVLMDVRTGELLVYASQLSQGEPFDVNLAAEAPAASIFKIVTAASLLENAGVTAQTEQCYRGGQSRISANELQEDPTLDHWCASLAVAMGRSINVVFARLAQQHLTAESLTQTAGAFGFGAPIPFDVKADAPRIDLPTEPVEFARAAAGFWHTSLSPLAGASIAQTVANDGVTFKPRIVRAILNADERQWRADTRPAIVRRAVAPQAAHELTKMMLQTVASGSAFKTFHDPSGNPYLPHILVASKTGTLTRQEGDRHYTWFVGFAPADKPEVAVAALVVNTPVWRIKAPQVARDVLRAYFSKRGFPGVTPP
jgi:penicillin-binding protein A